MFASGDIRRYRCLAGRTHLKVVVVAARSARWAGQLHLCTLANSCHRLGGSWQDWPRRSRVLPAGASDTQQVGCRGRKGQQSIIIRQPNGNDNNVCSASAVGKAAANALVLLGLGLQGHFVAPALF